MGTAATEAQHWIDRLNLEPHPEGGFYRQTYRASLILPHSALPGHNGDRAASTAIYFLLAGDQFSAFHRLRSDEVWHFYAGSALVVHVIEPGGNYRQLLLGSNAASLEQLQDIDQFQAVVPAGCWFGSSLRQPATYALAGCTVAPGFDFADFEMAKREELIAQYPQHGAIIEHLTRNNETASS
jgi:predicted cupin superfamily sugar epimerase